MIKFNKPYITGGELSLMAEAISKNAISGNGYFTKKCENWFESEFKLGKTFLTTSCTHALEMAALLCDISEGDEVIVPTFTFVSSANAFALRGANIVFSDSGKDHPNMDLDNIENLITKRTKAIVVMHYAGVAIDMNRVMSIAKKYNLFVIEDAALALGTIYENKYAGSFGHFACFSFHDTKNITCGEGGLLVVNDSQYIARAEVIREKGTNRNEFINGVVDKYTWVDLGSSYVPSELLAAFLYCQLMNFEFIQSERFKVWNSYFEALANLQEQNKIQLPNLINQHNSSIFYFFCNSVEQRTNLLDYCAKREIRLAFHYLPLHKSKFINSHISLPNAERFANTIIRLPLYPQLKDFEIQLITETIIEFFVNA